MAIDGRLRRGRPKDADCTRFLARGDGGRNGANQYASRRRSLKQKPLKPYGVVG